MEAGRGWFTTVCVLLLGMCLFIQKGLAIECFICNSFLHGDDCRNLPKETHYLYAQKCDDLAGNKTYTMCRKMVQKFKEDDRIIRQCASLGDLGCLKRIGTKHVNFNYCHCDTDMCNQGTMTIPHPQAALLVAIATYYTPRILQWLRG